MLIKKSTFKDKKLIISGLQGSGKTYLSRQLLKNFKVLVMSLNKDDKEYWKKQKNILVVEDNDLIKNFEYWLKKAKILSEKKIINCVFIDDADVFFKSHMDTNSTIRDLWSNHRHYGLTLIMVSHRLQDIPARLYGQLENLILFTIDNPQTVDLLNKFYKGLGDLVKGLPFKSYKFVLKEIGKAPKILKYTQKSKKGELKK